MTEYPLKFPVYVAGAVGSSAPWHAGVPSPSGAGNRPRDIVCSIPPEFDGPGGGFSPEDLFALAAANCFAATFQVIAQRSKLSVGELRIEGLLTVDRDTDPASKGRPMMKHLKLAVKVDPQSAKPERVRQILELTAKSCIVLNSLKTEVEFEFSV